MKITNIQDIILAVIGTWLALLTFLQFRSWRKWNKLTQGGKNLSLDTVLESIFQKEDLTTKQIEEVRDLVTRLFAERRNHLQKFALLRFNPFEDTGGDQSFAAAFLDGENSGIVISSLHSRNGTRVYAKGVEKGKPTTHQFSKEEKEVVEKAVGPERTK